MSASDLCCGPELLSNQETVPDKDTHNSHRVCESCHLPIKKTYYMNSDQTICTQCKWYLERNYRSVFHSDLLFRCFSFGTISAIALIGIYFTFLLAGGYDLKVLSLIFGAIIGITVSFASRKKGGWALQAIAMIITYLAIVSLDIPQFSTVMQDKEIVAVNTADSLLVTAKKAALSSDGSDLDMAQSSIFETYEMNSELLTQILFFIPKILYYTVMAIFFPFMKGSFTILKLFYIVIGLGTAWSLNRHPKLKICGPFYLPE